MKIECPRCHTRIDKPLQGEPVCPTCGFGGPAGTTPPRTAASTEAGAAPHAPPVGGSSSDDTVWPGQSTASGPSGPAAGAAATPQPGGGGAPPAWSVQGGYASQPPKQGLAITSLVLGIIGCCVLGLLAAIPAAITGGIAMNRAKKDPQQYGGYGMALTGLILGILGTVVSIIVLVAYAALFAAVLSGDLPPECREDLSSEECERALDEQDRQQDGAATVAWVPALILPSRRLFVPHAHAG